MYDIRQLTKVYNIGTAKVVALGSVSFSIADGAMLAIMGRGGSGKSTLLHQMGLLDRPTSGRILFDGKEVYLHVTMLNTGDYYRTPFHELLDISHVNS